MTDKERIEWLEQIVEVLCWKFQWTEHILDEEVEIIETAKNELPSPH